jgi:hypothetical protein
MDEPLVAPPPFLLLAVVLHEADSLTRQAFFDCRDQINGHATEALVASYACRVPALQIEALGRSKARADRWLVEVSHKLARIVCHSHQNDAHLASLAALFIRCVRLSEASILSSSGFGTGDVSNLRHPI